MFNQNDSNEKTLTHEGENIFLSTFLNDASLEGIRNPRIPFNFDHKLINVDAVDENLKEVKKKLLP